MIYSVAFDRDACARSVTLPNRSKQLSIQIALYSLLVYSHSHVPIFCFSMETRSERKRRLEENETAPDRPLEQVACSVDKDDMSSASARKKNELDPISPFENLPKEIIWMILEYVPEAVLKLREVIRFIFIKHDGTFCKTLLERKKIYPG